MREGYLRVVGVLVPASRHAENVRAPSLATRRADRDDRYADETRIIGNDVQGLYRSDRGHTLGGDGQACTKRPKPVNILRVITLTPSPSKMGELGPIPSSCESLSDVRSGALVVYGPGLHVPDPGHGYSPRLNPLFHHVQDRAGGFEVLNHRMDLVSVPTVHN